MKRYSTSLANVKRQTQIRRYHLKRLGVTIQFFILMEKDECWRGGGEVGALVLQVRIKWGSMNSPRGLRGNLGPGQTLWFICSMRALCEDWRRWLFSLRHRKEHRMLRTLKSSHWPLDIWKSILHLCRQVPTGYTHSHPDHLSAGPASSPDTC